MQKARRHPTCRLRPLVSVWFQDLFHSVIHGSFHLSLTVLVHYRSLRSIQPQRMVPPNSDRVSRAPPYSGYHYQYLLLLIQGYHLLWLTFPGNSNSIRIKYRGPTTPILPKQHWFGLIRVRSPLLTESLLFSSPPPTQMFQFSGFAPYRVLCLQHSGLPHSDIYGSIRVCQSPQLFAAYHVLHRL